MVFRSLVMFEVDGVDEEQPVVSIGGTCRAGRKRPLIVHLGTVPFERFGVYVRVFGRQVLGIVAKGLQIDNDFARLVVVLTGFNQ